MSRNNYFYTFLGMCPDMHLCNVPYMSCYIHDSMLYSNCLHYIP